MRAQGYIPTDGGQVLREPHVRILWASWHIVTVVPLTATLVKVHPFEVKPTAAETGLSKDGKALAQQVRTIDKSRVGSLRRGIVPAGKLRALDDALRRHLAL
ncbi:MAG: type II toxin-antitoxin system PemK/MazF family toxin [Burkholderiales bacterium]|nr:type II toxin-antitoxin system PemK/MazF family toxin [Burkholderiales bacterium]